MHNSVALSTVVMLCHNHHYHFQNLFIIPNRHCIPIKPQLPISATQPLVVSTLFSVSMILPIIDTLYKWNHTILSFFVWLLSLSKMFLRFVHIVAHITISLLFRLNNSGKEICLPKNKKTGEKKICLSPYQHRFDLWIRKIPWRRKW